VHDAREVWGDVSTARKTISAVMTREQYNAILTEQNGNPRLKPLRHLGVERSAPYKYRTSLRFGDGLDPVEIPWVRPSRVNMTSDTGELVWNQLPADKAHVLIRTPKTKGFIGFVEEETYDLGHGVTLEIGETIQGWANVLLTHIASTDKGHSWLLTATGYHENSGMVWKSDAKNSVGRNWGDGPPLAEAIPLRLTFSEPESEEPSPIIDRTNAQLTPLDRKSNGLAPLDNRVSATNNRLTVDLLESPPALWYEIRFPNDICVKNGEQY